VQLRTGNLPTRKIASNPPENGRAQRLRGIKCCMDAPNHMVNGFYATTQWPKTVINPSLDVIGSNPAVDHDPCFSPVDLSVDGRYFTRAPGHWFNTAKAVREVVRSTDLLARKEEVHVPLRFASALSMGLKWF
jgi:hypothetical protein